MTTPREFWVRPAQGLCNRLRSLLCGIAYAERTGRELVVAWLSSPGDVFRVHLDELWRHPYRTADSVAWRRAVRDSNTANYATKQPPPLDDPAGVVTMHSFGVYPPGRGCYADWLDRLRLAPDLAARVDAFRERLAGPDVVGVMVRTCRPRHKPDYGWFQDRMRALAAENTDRLFFLSTDHPTAYRRLAAVAPGRVVGEPDIPAFNSVDAIRKAIVDLYTLSHAGLILGSRGSSFSYTAYAMRQSRDGGGRYETPG